MSNRYTSVPSYRSTPRPLGFGSEVEQRSGNRLDPNEPGISEEERRRRRALRGTSRPSEQGLSAVPASPQSTDGTLQVQRNYLATTPPYPTTIGKRRYEEPGGPGGIDVGSIAGFPNTPAQSRPRITSLADLNEYFARLAPGQQFNPADLDEQEKAALASAANPPAPTPFQRQIGQAQKQAGYDPLGNQAITPEQRARIQGSLTGTIPGLPQQQQPVPGQQPPGSQPVGQSTGGIPASPAGGGPPTVLPSGQTRIYYNADKGRWWANANGQWYVPRIEQMEMDSSGKVSAKVGGQWIQAERELQQNEIANEEGDPIDLKGLSIEQSATGNRLVDAEGKEVDPSKVQSWSAATRQAVTSALAGGPGPGPGRIGSRAVPGQPIGSVQKARKFGAPPKDANEVAPGQNEEDLQGYDDELAQQEQEADDQVAQYDDEIANLDAEIASATTPAQKARLNAQRALLVRQRTVANNEATRIGKARTTTQAKITANKAAAEKQAKDAEQRVKETRAEMEKQRKIDAIENLPLHLRMLSQGTLLIDIAGDHPRGKDLATFIQDLLKEGKDAQRALDAELAIARGMNDGGQYLSVVNRLMAAYRNEALPPVPAGPQLQISPYDPNQPEAERSVWFNKNGVLQEIKTGPGTGNTVRVNAVTGQAELSTGGEWYPIQEQRPAAAPVPGFFERIGNTFSAANSPRLLDRLFGSQPAQGGLPQTPASAPVPAYQMPSVQPGMERIPPLPAGQPNPLNAQLPQMPAPLSAAQIQQQTLSAFLTGNLDVVRRLRKQRTMA